MENKTARLYFIDAMRAWAILMMLQGHFVDGLLDTALRDTSSLTFNVWKYFRGITAPVFFTVSGFIFTYLLVRGDKTGLKNPRIKKGIKRGLELLFIGYLLRLNLYGLLKGEIYASFYLVDVLHCIGLSILGIISIYLLTQNRKKYLFPLTLVGITGLLFLFEPIYKSWGFTFLPEAIANYMTKTNGSVFTIIPWFGYAAFGGFLSILFTKFKNLNYLYPIAITTAAAFGLTLIFFSSDFFLALSDWTGIQLFTTIYFNNYLFIRLGDVLVVFAIFMLSRSILQNSTLFKIGQSTLSIYVVHFIILYGSFTGLGLYGFLHHSLGPAVTIFGAIAFMLVSTYAALRYEEHKVRIKGKIATVRKLAFTQLEAFANIAFDFIKVNFLRLMRAFGLVKN